MDSQKSLTAAAANTLTLIFLVLLLATPGESSRPPRHVYSYGERPAGANRRQSQARKPAGGQPRCDGQGEETVTQTLAFNNALTTSPTQYFYYHYNLETDDGRPVTDTLHLTGFAVDVDQVEYVHHIQMFGCDHELSGTELEPRKQVGVAGCHTLLHAWAFNGEPEFFFPCHLGMPLGPGTKHKALKIQLHYNNPRGTAGVVDTSAVKLHLATAPRQHALAMLMLGDITLLHAASRDIPPGEPSWGHTHSCLIQTRGEAELTVYMEAHHMHKNGLRQWSETIAAGVARGADGKWHFAERAPAGGAPLQAFARTDNYEYSRPHPLDGNGTVLRHGDLVATTCVWNTERQAKAVRGGLGTEDEMCIHFMMVYPAEALEQDNCGLMPTPGANTALAGKWPVEKSYVTERPELLEAMLQPHDLLPLGYDSLLPSEQAQGAARKVHEGGHGRMERPVSQHVAHRAQQLQHVHPHAPHGLEKHAPPSLDRLARYLDNKRRASQRPQ